MKELTKEDRERVIEWLVDDDQFNMTQDNSQLVMLIREGFVGYDNMDDESLVNEYYARVDSLGAGDPLNLNF
jgi:hypothetical protein